mgnify:FL=1|jgi:hypothetical protein|tara:strand:+ start:790 stop:1701 length:912 start_codon:yes stop_codon:yes gene_type:complete
MPEHKLNLNPAEELVQIDDTGPEVDVEIEETQNSTFEAQPVKENILEAMPEEKVEEKVEDEHEEYSKGVQKRIGKLTAKLREAERREQAATQYAQNVHKENSTLKLQKQNTDGNYILSEANRITAETEATKTLLQKANEEQNIDAQVDAQQKLASLAVEAQRVQALNQRRTQQPVQEQQEFVQQEQEAPMKPDPRAEAWAEGNSWFGDDRAMTMTSFAIHEDLLNEGFDATSDEYYSEIDKRIRDEFPHKFGETSQQSRPAQAVAPAKRSAKTGRKSVRLTPSQVAIAKKLGVPLNEYAKYVE